MTALFEEIISLLIFDNINFQIETFIEDSKVIRVLSNTHNYIGSIYDARESRDAISIILDEAIHIPTDTLLYEAYSIIKNSKSLLEYYKET